MLGCATVVSRYMAWKHCGNRHFPVSGSRWDGTDSKNWDFFSVNERLRGGVGVIHLFKIGKQTLSSCNYIEFLFRVVHGATGPPDIAMMG